MVQEKQKYVFFESLLVSFDRLSWLKVGNLRHQHFRHELVQLVQNRHRYRGVTFGEGPHLLSESPALLLDCAESLAVVFASVQQNCILSWVIWVVQGQGGVQGREARAVVHQLTHGHGLLAPDPHLGPVVRQQLVVVQQPPVVEHEQPQGQHALGRGEHHGQGGGLPPLINLAPRRTSFSSHVCRPPKVRVSFSVMAKSNCANSAKLFVVTSCGQDA